MALVTGPFRAGREGYASYRIPAVVATASGTLLAFCEGRVDSARDHGHIDIVLKRSTDGGRTWGPLKTVANNGTDLLLFSGPAAPDARALMTLRASSDNGRTWRSAFTVDGLPAAYSDLVRVDASTVGLLYETGDHGAYETITFRGVPVTELT